MTGVPRTPRSEHPDDLGFRRQRMVGWFDPTQLARTGMRVVLSALFGSYADKREMQAALHMDQDDRDPPDYSAHTEPLWIDYLADTGDGWNSTYTMAKLVAAPSLTLSDRSRTLPRGHILVLGGDQVYPTAKRFEYENRFVGPFRAALPWVSDPQPLMFAVPGNHDWYDGLTSFLRLFCQNRSIGGWKTVQTRSYFAVKLPHKWWLWGIDVQLESDIDLPQLVFFQHVAEKHVTPGDHIVLCTATPSWVEAGRGELAGYKNLCYLERKIIQPHGAKLALTLTGDLHTYCRYADEDQGRQKIVAGGGGAYLYGTHTLPSTLRLDEGAGTPDDDRAATAAGDSLIVYQREKTFPSPAESRRLALGILRFPFMNWKFAFTLAAWSLVSAWFLQSVSKWLVTSPQSSFMVAVKDLSPASLGDIGRVWVEWWTVAAHGPPVVVLTALLVFGLTMFAGSERKWHRVVGLAHGLLHVGVHVMLVWGFAIINLRARPAGLGLDLDGPLQVLLFSGETFMIGGLAAGLLMGLYLLLTNLLLGMHTNEVFSGQRIEHYKNFLRLYFAGDGTLTIYPIGVRRVCKRWRFNPQAKDGQSWFEPLQAVGTHLIEGPIVITPSR